MPDSNRDKREKSIRIGVIKVIIDTNKKYQPYFAAYIKSNNLEDGDKVRSWEYMSWITEKHRQYRKKIGVGDMHPYTKEQEREFIKFIREE